MKTTWRRKRNNLPIPPFVLFTIGVLFLGWISLTVLSRIAPGSVEFLFSRIGMGEEVVHTAGATIGSFFTDKQELLTRIKRLEDSELALQLQLQNVSTIIEENENLREVLSFREREGVLGSVAAWPPKMAYDTLLIEVRDTVSVGDLVLGRGVVPIGRVSRVSGVFAYVTLFSQGGEMTQVRVGQDALPFELTGRGGGTAYILAPSDAPLFENDQVFFPYSGNTRMGTIGAIESDPASATKKAWVMFPTHPFAYTWVSVVPFGT